LIRAVERVELGSEGERGKRKFDTLILGLSPNREKLYVQIDQRVDKMLKNGLLTEVESLSEKYDRYAPAMRGHGYREILDFLAKEKDWKTAVAEIKRDTRNYAKRQITWWRNCGFAKEIIWL
jgi:tRNA dimethylallyltransferase